MTHKPRTDLPDFLVIGPPKAGTSSVYDLMLRHPGLFMSSAKEPKFFMFDADSEPHIQGRQKWMGEIVWREKEYKSLFAGAANDQLAGECTPLYLGSFRAHRNMAHWVPDAKLVAILRDPVLRAFSHWKYFLANAFEFETDFVKACLDGDRRSRLGWGPDWNYLGLGHYGSQLLHLSEFFPMDQILLIKYEDLVSDSRKELSKLWDFLGVEDLELPLPWENRTQTVAAGLRGRLLRRTIAVGGRIPTGAGGRRLRKSISDLLRRQYYGGRSADQTLRQADAECLASHFAEDRVILQDVFGFDTNGWIN